MHTCCGCSVKFKEAPSVTNPLAELNEVDKLTTTFDVPDSEYPADSFITDRHEDEKLPPGYVVIDIKNVRHEVMPLMYITYICT